MKKKLAIVFTTLALAVVVALNVNLSSSNNNNISALTMDNIEALASEGGDKTTYYIFYCSNSWNTNYYKCVSFDTSNGKCSSSKPDYCQY